MTESDVIQTGIYGLDQIFLGGILKGNLILVEGAAGTGKSLLGVEFIYRGITEHDEPGIIVVFETSPRKLIRDATGFGWNLDELQQRNKLKIIFTSPQVLDQELRSPDSLLLETAAEMGAQRIFIDGISLLRTLATGNGASGNGAASYRELLQQFIEGLQRENLTAMLSHEVLAHQEQSSALEVAEFLADTVIILEARTSPPEYPPQPGNHQKPGAGLRGRHAYVAYHRRQGVGGVPPRAAPGAWRPGSAYLRQTLAHRLRAARCPDRRRYLRRIHHHGRGHLGCRQDRARRAVAAGRSIETG